MSWQSVWAPVSTFGQLKAVKSQNSTIWVKMTQLPAFNGQIEEIS